MFITDIDGLSFNDVNINETELASQPGSTPDNMRVKPKTLTIQGRIAENFRFRQAILKVVTPGKMARLRYIDDDYDIDWYIEGTPVRTPDFSNNPTWQNFQFTFHTFYPYWKDINETIVPFSVLVSQFMLPRSFSSTEPWYIATREQSPLQQIVNEGSADTGFIVVWEALNTVTGPRLTKVETQETISFPELTLIAGDVLEVSTYNDNKYTRLTREGVTTNVFGQMDDDSTFFQLNVGNNIVRGGADSSENSVLCQLFFNNTFVGV